MPPAGRVFETTAVKVNKHCPRYDLQNLTCYKSTEVISDLKQIAIILTDKHEYTPLVRRVLFLWLLKRFSDSPPSLT